MHAAVWCSLQLPQNGMEASCGNVIHRFQALYSTRLQAERMPYKTTHTHANNTVFKQVALQQKTKEPTFNKSHAHIV